MEEPIGEISPAALLVASKYPGLSKAEIARISANKFRPENLYKLYHLKGQEDKDQDENITIENGWCNSRELPEPYNDLTLP